jgi:predicted Zn finger-like uncharacterized protein
MLLTCPSCETSFRVDPEALGPTGRTVRCACCQTSWFAEAAVAVRAPVMAEASVMEDGEVDVLTASLDDQASIPEAPTEDEAAPPLAPDDDQAAPFATEATAAESIPARKVPPRRPAPRKSSRKRLAVAAVAAASAFVVLLIAARARIVGVVPDLAGIYAAVGLPVNLRGLEFRSVRTSSETQDGITVLVIEGEVVNIARRAVEVPRLRLAVLGNGGQELYSWTTLLPRSTLSEDEKVSFRSRLASPPAEGREVLVRFLTRSDLTSAR